MARSVERRQQQGVTRRGGRTFPRTMAAAAIDRFGDPDELTLRDLPLPALAPDEVLIALHSAGVNSWDVAERAGWVPPDLEARFPLVLGSDGAGTVAAVGARVRRFKAGERVYAACFECPYAKGGFYAGYVAVAAKKVAFAPKGLDLEHAAALPHVGLTALQGVDDALALARGETVLVHGASGAVGSVAVQFARARGARVIGTGRGDDALAFVRDLGVDLALDGERDDLADEVRRFAPDGVNAVLAFAGGAALERCLDALAPGGRVAYPNGVEPEPRPRDGVAITAYDGVPGVREFKRLERAIHDVSRTSKALQVPIAASFPLAEAAQAHERLAAGHVLGHVVLRIR